MATCFHGPFLNKQIIMAACPLSTYKEQTRLIHAIITVNDIYTCHHNNFNSCAIHLNNCLNMLCQSLLGGKSEATSQGAICRPGYKPCDW